METFFALPSNATSNTLKYLIWKYARINQNTPIATKVTFPGPLFRSSDQ
jgi:hypothetical protein